MIILDTKLAKILSDFCSDIAKAYFIATFVAPSFTIEFTGYELTPLLLRGLANVILFLFLAWEFAKLENKKQT